MYNSIAVQEFLKNKYPDIHFVDLESLDTGKTKITFTPSEIEVGYKKVFLSEDDNHAEPVIAIYNKEAEPTLLFLGKFKYSRFEVGGCNIISNSLIGPVYHTMGCAEYSISVLERFDSKIIMQNRDTKELKEVFIPKDINLIIDSKPKFITERQLQLCQSREVLKELGVDASKFVTKDSEGNKVTVADYHKKYSFLNRYQEQANCALGVLKLTSRPVADCNEFKGFGKSIENLTRLSQLPSGSEYVKNFVGDFNAKQAIEKYCKSARNNSIDIT